MTSAHLTPHQQQLRNIIEDNLQICKKWQELPRPQVDQAFHEMKTAAHELHISLNPHPQHHEYMIRNRGMQPEDPEFYNHIHPTEDLLDYLDDVNANDDPVDLTLGDSFNFSVYTRRWGHRDSYTLIRNQNGWEFMGLAYNGQCDQEGNPVLFEALEHDSVSYPRNLSSVLWSIWKRAKEKGLTHDQVQNMLNETADWVSSCEENTPDHIIL